MVVYVVCECALFPPRRLAILAHPAMRVCMRARAFVCVRAARSYGHALKRVHTSSGLIPHPSPTAPHPQPLTPNS